LIKILELVRPFGAKDFIPDVNIDYKHEHQYSDVNFSCREDCCSILNEGLYIENKPVLCCNE
jgi:hypothetical protein